MFASVTSVDPKLGPAGQKGPIFDLINSQSFAALTDQLTCQVSLHR